MRTSATIFAAMLLIGSIACSSEGAGPDGDDPTDADAGADDVPEPETGFQIVSPDIALMPGEEATWCYYTVLPVDVASGVKKWESVMTPGSHHMILYTTASETRPDGTLTEDCEVFGGGFDAPVWTYAAQTPEAEFPMPEGVGMSIAANQPVVVQMHYLNASDSELVANVTINGHTFAGNESYQKAAAYVTYNTQINVPPGQSGGVSGTCQIPSGASFFTMSTHSHQFSTQTRVSDAGSMVVVSDDWEHPEVAEFPAAPFFQFQSGSLTYECDYFNTSNAMLQTGDSAETDEMCMAVGYFFPADGPVFCLNSFVVPL